MNARKAKSMSRVVSTSWDGSHAVNGPTRSCWIPRTCHRVFFAAAFPTGGGRRAGHIASAAWKASL
jgi:hypothetical protein